MISILVDEGYAFDYLSILFVKSTSLNSSKSAKAFEECKSHIKSQIADDKFLDIIRSIEYQNLITANIETFNAVERARKGFSITAKEVDDCNMKRFQAKVDLQKKFFNESCQIEEKS